MRNNVYYDKSMSYSSTVVTASIYNIFGSRGKVFEYNEYYRNVISKQVGQFLVQLYKRAHIGLNERVYLWKYFAILMAYLHVGFQH